MNTTFSNTLKARCLINIRKSQKRLLNFIIKLTPLKKLRNKLREKLPNLISQRNKKIIAPQSKSLFLVTCNTSNLGDLYCCPALYFNLSPIQEIYDIINTFNSNDRILTKNNIIIGGGDHTWLITNENMQKSLKGSKNIAWGVGAATQHHLSDALLSKFELFGIRNFTHPQIDNKKVFYVPCASCFLNELQINYPIKNKIAFYLHNWTDPNVLNNIKSNWPCIDNYGEIRKAVEFLGSAEIIVTNSYHGVYWATLMNKKVVAISYGVKFEGYKFAPVFATFETWKDKIEECKSYPDALDDCKQINMDFYKRVVNTLET